MTAPGTKPCATCGAPVADAALGRGALEDPDGRRYCSPCAATLLKSDQPAAQALRAVNLRPPRQSSAMIIAAKRASSTRMAPARKAAPEPPAPAPADRRAPSAAAVPAVAARQSSTRVLPAKKSSAGARPDAKAEGGQRPTASSSRVSRRLSARAGLPWYLRLTRGQLIGAICGGIAAVLLLIIGIAVGCRKSKPQPQAAPPTVTYSSEAHRLIAEADALADARKPGEAVVKLQKATNVANAAAEQAAAAAKQARIAGFPARAAELEQQAKIQENLAVLANRKRNGIYKTTPVRAN